MNRPARALVLDFSGPLVRTPFEMMAAYEYAHRLPRGALGSRGPFDQPPEQRWAQVLVGELTEREYWRARATEAAPTMGLTAARRGPLAAYLRAYFAALFPDLADAVRPESQRLVEATRTAGVRVGILTNDVSVFHPADRALQLPVVAQADAYVDCSVSGVLKPDPRAYRQILALLGVRACDAVFVDDLPRNLAGAVAVGMTAVPFDITDPAASYGRVAAAAGLAAQVR